MKKNNEHKEKMLNAMKALTEMNVSKTVDAIAKKIKGEDKTFTISDLLRSEKGISFFKECEERGLKLKDAKAQFCEILGVEVSQATLKKVMNELDIYTNKSKKAASQQSKGREEERDMGVEVEEEKQPDFNVNVEIENIPSSFSIAHEHPDFESESDIR